MGRTYIKWLPVGLVVGVVGLIIGLVMRAKNAPQVQECGTKIMEMRQMVSPSFRATCSSAKSMAGLGVAVSVACGVIVAIAVVIRIVYLMSDRERPA